MFGSSFQHSQSAFFTRIPLQCNTSQASLTHPAAVPKEYDYEVAKYLREKLHMEATIKLSESETEVARITVRTPISLPSSARLCLARVVLITVKRCNKVSANFCEKSVFWRKSVELWLMASGARRLRALAARPVPLYASLHLPARVVRIHTLQQSLPIMLLCFLHAEPAIRSETLVEDAKRWRRARCTQTP